MSRSVLLIGNLSRLKERRCRGCVNDALALIKNRRSVAELLVVSRLNNCIRNLRCRCLWKLLAQNRSDSCHNRSAEAGTVRHFDIVRIVPIVQTVSRRIQPAASLRKHIKTGSHHVRKNAAVRCWTAGTEERGLGVSRRADNGAGTGLIVEYVVLQPVVSSRIGCTNGECAEGGGRARDRQGRKSGVPSGDNRNDIVIEQPID